MEPILIFSEAYAETDALVRQIWREEARRSGRDLPPDEPPPPPAPAPPPESPRGPNPPPVE